MKREWDSALRLGAAAFWLYPAILYWPKASPVLAAPLHSAAPLAAGCVIAYLLNILPGLYEQEPPGFAGGSS